MRLNDLALKYGSDKSNKGHDYMPFYEEYLPEKPKKILEIGVLKGSSIRMWKEAFPEAEIHGLDLFEANEIPDIPGVIWHRGSQIDTQLLARLRKEKFDVVIDDGSHNSRDQLITFFGLFTHGVSYFVEDCHCCDEEFYRQGLPEGFTIKRIAEEANKAYSNYDMSILMFRND